MKLRARLPSSAAVGFVFVTETWQHALHPVCWVLCVSVSLCVCVCVSVDIQQALGSRPASLQDCKDLVIVPSRSFCHSPRGVLTAGRLQP